jgi:hypothetical protein
METTMKSRRAAAQNPEGVANEGGKDARAIKPSGLKAGLTGSAGLMVVLLISLVPIPFPLGTCLVTLGFVVVWIGTGMLAGVLAESEIQTRRQAVTNGAMAGFVAGIGGGIAAMVIAAFGALFPDLGEGVLAQFSPGQLQALAQIGFGPDIVRLAGSILSAMMACGAGGTVVSIALGALGGRIYFRLR